MTRESKLALIIGFVLVLVVGVLVSDHFSQANTMMLDQQASNEERIAAGPITQLGQREQEGIKKAVGSAFGTPQRTSAPVQQFAPVEIRNGRSSVATNSNAPGSILDRALNHVQETEFPQAAQRSQRSHQPKSRPLPGSTTIKHDLYKVVAGDSLIKIARKKLGDGQRWNEIHTLNADVLGPDAILKIGVYLKLPADAKQDGTRSGTTQSRSTSPTSYKVVSGDTLGQISMKFLGTSKRADEIAELNGLESANSIRIGMTLKIPAK